MGSIATRPFGEVEGRPATLFTLTRGNLSADITDYGGTLVGLRAPDRAGAVADVVLGFDSVDGYRQGQPYLGAVLGRYANRIGGARFTIDGETFVLSPNDGRNHLHGGACGFDKVSWRATAEETDRGPALVLRYVSPDGEEGYPGALSVETVYRLTDDALELSFSATTDRPTAVNLSHHAYWNLAGHDAGDILDHRLTVHAASYTPSDGFFLPTGEIRPLDGTPFDFRRTKMVGADLIRLRVAPGGGFDINYAVDGAVGTLRRAAELFDPRSGRVLEVSSTAPGLQFYSGQGLGWGLVGKGGVVYRPCAGLCLEPQNFPDAPNRPEFPPAILRPGETYRHAMRFRLAAREPVA